MEFLLQHPGDFDIFAKMALKTNELFSGMINLRQTNKGGCI